jgi:hypothetical protein
MSAFSSCHETQKQSQFHQNRQKSGILPEPASFCCSWLSLTLEAFIRLPSAKITSKERQESAKMPYLWDVVSNPAPQMQPPAQYSVQNAQEYINIIS